MKTMPKAEDFLKDFGPQHIKGDRNILTNRRNFLSEEERRKIMPIIYDMLEICVNNLNINKMGTKLPEVIANLKSISNSTKTKKATKMIKMTSVSRTRALNMIQGSGGKFFSATFINKKGTEETLANCQYSNQLGVNPLGYVRVKVRGRVKQINLNTLKNFRIEGYSYKIKK
jgi:hypothetical protein